MHVKVKVLVAQSCLTLCDPMDCSPPGCSVRGIHQARILEWVAIPFSRGSSQPRDWTQVSCIARRFFQLWDMCIQGMYVGEYWDVMQNTLITVDWCLKCWNSLNMQQTFMLLLTCQTPCHPSLPHSFILLKNIRCPIGGKHPAQSYGGTKTYQKP